MLSKRNIQFIRRFFHVTIADLSIKRIEVFSRMMKNEKKWEKIINLLPYFSKGFQLSLGKCFQSMLLTANNFYSSD